MATPACQFVCSLIQSYVIFSGGTAAVVGACQAFGYAKKQLVHRKRMRTEPAYHKAYWHEISTRGLRINCGVLTDL